MAENRTLKGIYGEAGVHYVATGLTVVGEFCAITSVHIDTIVTVVSAKTTKDQQGDAIANAATITGIPLPAGTTIYGQFTSVTIGGAAGKAIVYNAAK